MAALFGSRKEEGKHQTIAARCDACRTAEGELTTYEIGGYTVWACADYSQCIGRAKELGIWLAL
jgi:hypothetical protein